MKIITTLIMLVLLVGCGGTGSVKDFSQLEKENKGIVIGGAPSLAKKLLVVGNRLYIHFQAIDGKPLEHSFMNGWPNELELSAGKHTLTVICTGNINTVEIRKVFPVTLTIASGHKYLLKPELTSNSCIAKIEDITNNKN